MSRAKSRAVNARRFKGIGRSAARYRAHCRHQDPSALAVRENLRIGGRSSRAEFIVLQSLNGRNSMKRRKDG